MRKLILKTLTLKFLCLFFFGMAHAQSTDEIRQKLEKNLGDGATVEKIAPSPYAGLYEVVIQGQIFYTDKNADYFFVGRMLDSRSKKDLTQERMAKLHAADLFSSPLVIKRINGDGKRVITVFSDPNCGYCKKYDHVLKQLKNTTIHLVLFPFLSQDSVEKARNIWCASNPLQAYEDWMSQGKVPPTAAASCKFPLKEIQAFARAWGVKATPISFFRDGSRLEGGADLGEVEKILQSIPDTTSK